jgi:hypothetical protein
MMPAGIWLFSEKVLEQAEILSNVYLLINCEISNFRRVLNVVCFLLGNSSAHELNGRFGALSVPSL